VEESRNQKNGRRLSQKSTRRSRQALICSLIGFPSVFVIGPWLPALFCILGMGLCVVSFVEGERNVLQIFAVLITTILFGFSILAFIMIYAIHGTVLPF